MGGCSVSTLHAGFLVNDQQGSACDYLSLIAQVQKTVYEKTGVRLEPEVKITKFEDEDLMRTSGVIVGGDPDVEGPDVGFED